jgi:hypothetical protein
MTESSFPIVNADFTDSQWSQIVGSRGSGILDDWGNPYGLTIGTDDTITIGISTRSGVARAVVGGFGHQMDAAVKLSVPTGANDYHVGLLYAPTGTPTVRLVVLAGSTPTVPAGGAYSPMYKIRRAAGQTLATAAVFRMRTRVQPRISVETQAGLLEVSPLLYLAGTLAYAQDTDRLLRAGGTVATPLWVPTEGAQMATFTGAGLYNNTSGLQNFTPPMTAIAEDTRNNWFASTYTGTYTSQNNNGDYSGIRLEPGSYVCSHHYSAGNAAVQNARNIALAYLKRKPGNAFGELARGGVTEIDDSTTYSSAFVVDDVATMRFLQIVQVTGTQPTTVRHRVKIIKVA